MPKRLSQTALDYVVIALSPALIMTLVGSLVFFLLLVFYQGQFNARLNWVMACFVFAAVLIGRISIEDGWERAMPFGLALAVSVSLAISRFVTIQGTWVDNFSWLINNGMIALIWWCAHRLTWDCTVIDDAEDASGEGLLQIAGLEARPAEAGDAAAGSKRAVGPDGKTAFDRAVEGTTSRAVPAGWWQRYVQHQRRPHAPGVWVVYFSLAALPLFGIGQWFIPESNAAGRARAFQWLAVYVASGLGLLLTTSFLGLRRYLRQRRIEMPLTMANLWLSIGAALIVLLLVFAALLPRPSAEYALARLPFSLGSPDQQASRMSPTSQEGAEGEQPGSARDTRPEDERESAAEDQQSSSAADTGQRADADAKTGPGGVKAKADQTGSAKDSAASQASGSTDSKDSSKGGQSREQGEGRDQGQSKEKAEPQESSQTERQNATQSKAEPPNESRQANQQASESRSEPGPKAADSAKSPQEPAAPSSGPSQITTPPLAAPALGVVAQVLQWVVYGVVAVAVVYGIWRFRREIFRAIQEFIASLRDLFAGLFGARRPRTAAEDERMQAVEFPPVPFSSFADPFASGMAERLSREELVRYSFEAFEAWSREHGSVRMPDVTPHELARAVGKRQPHIASEARALAESYACAAYADGRVPPAAVDELRKLWLAMRADAQVAW